MSDEQYDYTPKPARGRKAKPASSASAVRKRKSEEATDYTPRPARRKRADRASRAGSKAKRSRRKKRASRSKSFKIGSFLRSRAFMSVAGILGLIVLLGGSLLVLLPGGGANAPSGSPIEMGNYYYDQAIRLWDSADYDGALTALQEAATYYEQALAQTPEDAQVRTDLGAVYFYQSRLLSDNDLLQRAIETWQVALQYEPDKPEALFNMGLGYADLGEVDQAIALWQRVIEVSPGSDAAQSAERLIQEYSGAIGP